jgi:hypothetical protein
LIFDLSPSNLEDGDYDAGLHDYEDESTNLSFGNKHAKPDYYDDDERFALISRLDLSHNLFKSVNLQHMLQSVANIEVLDLSHNPMKSIFHLSGERSVVSNDKGYVHNKSGTDDFLLKL